MFFLTLLVSLAAAGVCLSTLFGFLGRFWWRFELFSHFRVQYALLLAAATVVLLALGAIPMAIVSAAFGLANLALIQPFYGWKPSDPPRKTYRLLLANVLQENQKYPRVLELAQATQPDFIALLEVGEAWMAALEPLRAEYPYVCNEFWGEENYDIALFSRLPAERLQVEHFPPNHVPTIVGRFCLPEGPLTVIATHPAPPKTKAETEARNRQMAEIAGYVLDLDSRVILAGDLNMSSWSPAFTDFVRASGLRDSRRQRGVQASWPVNIPWLRIPLDHVLYSCGVQIERRTLGPDVGSDHRPVIVDFSLV